MGYSKQVVEKVREEYAAKRENAEKAVTSRTAEMYAKVPELKRIDDALSSTGLRIYRTALEGKDGLEERVDALKKETESLRDDKRRILKMAGKPEDYLDIKYACPKCSDTGYVGLDMCDCMRKALIKASYESSGLGAALKEQGFDNFDLEYYSDKKASGGISPRENMSYIVSEAKSYVKNFGKSSKGENLLFIGKTGLGKTHISTAIAKGVIEKGYDVVYDTVQNIMHAYEAETFSRNADMPHDLTEKYMLCELLIIDDLGTEFKSSFTQSVLYNLLNTRIITGKAMIINTNLDDSELFKKNYDDRINSRLIGSFRTFKFFGEDIRIKKAIEKK